MARLAAQVSESRSCSTAMQGGRPSLELTANEHFSAALFLVSHGATKLIHVLFNVLALGCIAIGLYVTFDANPAPHVSVPT